MQAFNLTRLNFHSPYKVWIDNGSYKFLHDGLLMPGACGAYMRNLSFL